MRSYSKGLLLLLMFGMGGEAVLAAEAANMFSMVDDSPQKPVPQSGAPCSPIVPGQVLDVLDVVNLALCNNPQTREVWANSRAQAAQVGVSKANYLPSLDLNATGSSNSSGSDQRSVSLTLSYLLFDFGARAANLENARQLLAATSAIQDGTVQAVFLSAVQAYYQVQATQAALDAAVTAERSSKQSAAAADARYGAGSSTRADKLQALTAASQATLNRITAEGNMKKATGALANIIGLDADQVVSLKESNTEPVPEDFEQGVKSLIEEARKRRPDLIAAEAQVKAAEASADSSRAADRPTVSLSASSKQSSGSGLSANVSSVGITLNVPLFSGRAPAYRTRAAEAKLESLQAQLERVRLQVALDVWNAYQNLMTATQSLRTTAFLLNSAEQSERVALGRYQAGVGNMLDVLNAQNALANARQQRIQSTFDWNISRATLAQVMGSLDDNLLHTLSPEIGEKEHR
ncbi:MAG: TolC family protein [Gallionella sp.]|nr:TolC family protein [Gallionella sp.]